MLAANPSYHHQLFDDVDVENFIYTQCAPRWIALYETLPTVIQRLDLFRILAVYELGGFYFDLDMSVDGPLDALLRHHAVFAEEVHLNTDAFLRVRGITNLYANYTFGGAQRHPVFPTPDSRDHGGRNQGPGRCRRRVRYDTVQDDPVLHRPGHTHPRGGRVCPRHRAPKGERTGIEVLVHAEENHFGSYGTHHLMHSWVTPGKCCSISSASLLLIGA